MASAYLTETFDTFRRLVALDRAENLSGRIADLLVAALSGGKKILLAGNGGSAADCQHIAGELVCRFMMDRRALPAIALTVDTSVLTAVLNDMGAEQVFARQVEALGEEGDVLWAFSTSGNSPNIIRACAAARAGKMKILGFTGESGGRLPELCDVCFRAPSPVTAHVQECHIAVGHMLCAEIETRLFGKG